MVPPRIILVLPDQWKRALLRAALREGGYDAAGAVDLENALHYESSELNRGPVRLLILDQEAVDQDAGARLPTLRSRHPDAFTLLLGRSAGDPPRGRWDHILRRPMSVGDITDAVEQLLPLAPTQARPVDE